MEEKIVNLPRSAKIIAILFITMITMMVLTDCDKEPNDAAVVTNSDTVAEVTEDEQKSLDEELNIDLSVIGKGVASSSAMFKPIHAEERNNIGNGSATTASEPVVNVSTPESSTGVNEDSSEKTQEKADAPIIATEVTGELADEIVNNNTEVKSDIIVVDTSTERQYGNYTVNMSKVELLSPSKDADKMNMKYIADRFKTAGIGYDHVFEKITGQVYRGCEDPVGVLNNNGGVEKMSFFLVDEYMENKRPGEEDICKLAHCIEADQYITAYTFYTTDCVDSYGNPYLVEIYGRDTLPSMYVMIYSMGANGVPEMKPWFFDTDESGSTAIDDTGYMLQIRRMQAEVGYLEPFGDKETCVIDEVNLANGSSIYFN